jgi:hypothetical protein
MVDEIPGAINLIDRWSWNLSLAGLCVGSNIDVCAVPVRNTQNYSWCETKHKQYTTTSLSV